MLIESGFVTNIIEAEPEYAATIRAIAAPINARVGCAIVGGNCLPIPVPPPKVPESVTMRQARLALLNAGLLATVNTAIAAMPGASGDAARIEWEFSSEVFRHRTLVLSLGAGLGLTAAQLDSLFIVAKAIE